MRYGKKVAGTALGKTWGAGTRAMGTDWRQVSFLVCDAEMSSLDANEGELLSLGWVSVEGGAIALESAQHYLVKAGNSVGQSAAIHQLRDCDLEGGRADAELLNIFLSAAAGCILVFHNAALDTAFLNRLTWREFGAPLLMPTIDTLLLEEAKLRRNDVVIKAGDLRLQSCRERYNLPVYPAHNALVDALATAELLLAHVRHRSGSERFPLRKLL
ncbi:MAG: 3'-5' exonuclease [Gammaproteobacteria bacterium]|nr:MAG: 3'-5' exonuclease [Gammaproteobacteria bacterium]